jgi:predicted unusual protein kinase regulating ubiquinone biosynthesis (AarF/ABC1/UbiB family)
MIFTADEKKAVRSRSLAKYLLESILQLGPTFIKIGQLSSTRSDLFPGEFVEELTKLQDRVPAFSTEKAIAIIEKDLGQPIDKVGRGDRIP